VVLVREHEAVKTDFNNWRQPPSQRIRAVIKVMRVTRNVITFIALLSAAGSIEPVSAQSSKSPLGIDVTYVAPTDAKYTAVMERLKARHVLEQLRDFGAPLRLPHAFHLIARECHEENAFYSPSEWSLTLCYELIDEINRDAPKSNQMKEGVTHADVVLGEVVFVVLHELGHAAFDMLQVPVFGREEDAADQMAVFLAMQFSPEVARTIVRGDYYFFNNHDDPTEWSRYADEHGTDSQRLYNGLCWAYGGNPQLFKDFVEQGLLPQGRAIDCANEYRQISDAFTKTVLPFIDEEARKVVQARDWFKQPNEK
jgi:Putative metallopeptidase